MAPSAFPATPLPQLLPGRGQVLISRVFQTTSRVFSPSSGAKSRPTGLSQHQALPPLSHVLKSFSCGSPLSIPTRDLIIFTCSLVLSQLLPGKSFYTSNGRAANLHCPKTTHNDPPFCCSYYCSWILVSWPSQELNNQFWIEFIGWLLCQNPHMNKANHKYF